MDPTEKAALALEPDARLRLIASLWDSLVDDVGDGLPIDEATRDELDARISAHDAAPEDTLSWDEVVERVPRPGRSRGRG
ncbi:MAG: addiction module protein [Deltaproteobacteria bacterium]|nr:addiction module protein [Nannocystaceae bacterium]